jgi:transposase
MEVLDARCSGIDIHKKSITVCVRIREPGARKKSKYASSARRLQRFLRCRDWLQDLGVTHVVMESTGVYWRSIWNLLEGRFEYC